MTHTLPPLPYDVPSLEPYIDARTMALHHGKHHAGYVEKLNAAIAPFPELHERSASWLLLNLRRLPEESRVAVRNNAGGHVNHSLLWKTMTPRGAGAPAGELADAIDRDFGSFGQLKTRFAEAAADVLGSGWIWLARAQHNGGRLRVLATRGNGNPVAQEHFPVLVNDLWEHAYYLKHENRRPEYLEGWWPVVDWDEAARRFREADLEAPRNRTAQHELLLEAS